MSCEAMSSYDLNNSVISLCVNDNIVLLHACVLWVHVHACVRMLPVTQRVSVCVVSNVLTVQAADVKMDSLVNCAKTVSLWDM